MRTNKPADGSISDLIGQLADDGRALIRAEISLYREIALYRASKARNGIIAVIAGGLLVYAGLIAALVGVVFGLASKVGPVAGGLIVLVVAALAGFALIRFGIKKIAALWENGSEEESEETVFPAGEPPA